MAVAFIRPDILYAWKGPSLLVVNRRGECGPDDPLSGFYFREARFLQTLGLRINGERPWLCEAASIDPESLALNFVHPEIKTPGGGGTGRPVPGAYPRANTPQLWNATAFPLLVQTMLGLLPLASLNTLVLDPALPAWIPELIVRDLRVGDARVTLRFWRDGGGASKWEVEQQQGTLHILRQPPPESLSAKWTDRIRGVVQSL